MRRSRFTEERIVRIPRETRGGGKVKDVCARHNVSERTYYGWKRRYGGMEVNEPRQARAMAEENTRLKRVIAGQALQIDILKTVSAKKW